MGFLRRRQKASMPGRSLSRSGSGARPVPPLYLWSSRGSQGRFREHGARPAARGPPTGLDGFGTAIVTSPMPRALLSRCRTPRPGPSPGSLGCPDVGVDVEREPLAELEDHGHGDPWGQRGNLDRCAAPPDGLPQFLLRDVVDVLMRLLAWPRRNGPTWPPESHRSMERKWRRMDGVGCGNGNEWHVCHSLIPQVRALSQASDLGPCSLTRKRSEVQIP